MRFTLVPTVGGAEGGELWLDIVGIEEGQKQLTPLSSVGVFFFVLSGSSGGSAVTESCFDEAKVT